MIDASILKVLARKCPNYHIVSERFAKGTFSVCTCKNCRFSVLGTNAARTKPERNCKPLLDRLIEDGMPIGYARVDAFGTCDAASFVPDDGSPLRLESERAVINLCRENSERAQQASQDSVLEQADENTGEGAYSDGQL